MNNELRNQFDINTINLAELAHRTGLSHDKLRVLSDPASFVLLLTAYVFLLVIAKDFPSL
ncbi:MAG: hypothetical protein PHY47_17845 [Lachnospiraceae bacterium]|nr:hypothetical protein [Lachnospiraceae bacterium]